MSVYVDGLVQKVVRAALPSQVQVNTLLPGNYLQSMPLVIVKDVSGSSAVDPRFNSTRAVVQIDSYNADKRQSWYWCDQACRALIQSWLNSTGNTEGRISYISVQAEPSELRFPDQPSNQTRYSATHLITFRK